MDESGEIIKEDPMVIDGRVMTIEEFVTYCKGLEFEAPLPTRVFLHHTWRPTLASWQGLDSIMAMKAYYEKQQWTDSEGQIHEGWTAGPHIFVAEDGIWLFSDLRYDGVGVYGHNYRSRHIEMVGNYDNKLPSGAVLRNTVAVLGILHECLGLEIANLNFHRDFSTKTCPGSAVQKGWIIPQVESWIADYRASNEAEQSTLRQALVHMIRDLLVSTHPEFALAKNADSRGLLGALTHEIPMEIDNKGYIVQLFTEALIVEVNQWDRVQTLQEYEQQIDLTESADVERSPDGSYSDAPPVDPYRFDGHVR